MTLDDSIELSGRVEAARAAALLISAASPPPDLKPALHSRTFSSLEGAAEWLVREPKPLRCSGFGFEHGLSVNCDVAIDLGLDVTKWITMPISTAAEGPAPSVLLTGARGSVVISRAGLGILHRDYAINSAIIMTGDYPSDIEGLSGIKWVLRVSPTGQFVQQVSELGLDPDFERIVAIELDEMLKKAKGRGWAR